MENQQIVINDDVIKNSEHLHDTLEELYLGERKTYKVYLQKKHLNRLENIFDRIIQQNGWRPVEFDYFLGYQ